MSQALEDKYKAAIPVQDGWGGTPTVAAASAVGAGVGMRSDRSDKRSRSRERRSDRSRRTRRSSRSRSRRRSRSGDRKKKKKKKDKKKEKKKRKSNFDVGPDGSDMSGVTGTGGGATTVGGFGVPAFVAPTPSLQQTRHARRLYVGGVPETSDQELMTFFNERVQRALPEPILGGAVVSVYLNLERKFAFVEFKTIELTTACLALDGIVFQGQNLAVRRPSDYQPSMVPQSAIEVVPTLDMQKLGMGGSAMVTSSAVVGGVPGAPLATRIPNGPGKIYLGGLPYGLAEKDVQPFLEAFGPLKGLTLMRDPGVQTTKGWGFCEYQDVSITQIACQALNGTALGDRQLIMRPAQNSVGAAGAGANPMLSGLTGSQLASMTLNAASAMGGMGGAMGGMPMGGVPGMMGMPAAAGAAATPVLILKNMVAEDELSDPTEVEDIKLDIKEECAKYGTVTSIKVPTPGQPGVGKVFVEFASAMEAGAAAQRLGGRTFGKRTVVTEFLALDKFQAGQLD